ncbi:DUF1003 domain-containing protein [Paracoccus marcusii]|uniref:DUF1003 domain-containing protein n=1 Tax=Paracoccus marcusii TaxID=59779 RepID=UPI003137E2C6
MVPMRTSAPRTRSQIRPLPYLRTDLSADGAACLNVSSPWTVRLDRDGATGLIRWPHHLPDRSGAISQAIRLTHAGGRAWRAVDLGQNRARQSGGWHDSVVPAGAGAGRSPDLRRPDNRQGRTFWRHLAAHPGVRRRPWRHGSARTSRACCDRPPIPTPYLVLSCVATLQAPIIIMSQRRQETKNRLRGKADIASI